MKDVIMSTTVGVVVLAILCFAGWFGGWLIWELYCWLSAVLFEVAPNTKDLLLYSGGSAFILLVSYVVGKELLENA